MLLLCTTNHSNKCLLLFDWMLTTTTLIVPLDILWAMIMIPSPSALINEMSNVRYLSWNSDYHIALSCIPCGYDYNVCNGD